ncbi:olfactory receptor 14A2-like [Tachyglossus aculeatus]|uniref:olfactory receptor 14A2-like n=1 Tax=Tachyglossus aculeatus TaxID=9261 RepID=UPI0018F4F753|nr:olfactory receptor 14A2-like [Tachyglossus aculeatus]
MKKYATIPFCKLCPFSETPWTVHRFSQNVTNITTVTEFFLLWFSDIRELQLAHSTLFLQVYLVLLVILLVGAELLILTLMFYNRYVVICLPLCYNVTINRETCLKMATSSWIGGGIFGVMYTAGPFSLRFCGLPVAPQFFCDAPSLLMVSCSETHVVFNFSLASGFVCSSFSSVSFVTLYIRIFWAELRMPATEGRGKAFSTCLPHLTIVTVFLFTASVAFLKPPSDSPSAVDLLVSLLYTTVTPLPEPPNLQPEEKNLEGCPGEGPEWGIHSL